MKFIPESIWDPIPNKRTNVEKYPARGYPYPTPKDVVGCTVMVFDGKKYPTGEIEKQNGKRVWVKVAQRLIEAVWDAGEGLYVPA